MLNSPVIAEKYLVELTHLESRIAAMRSAIVGMERRSEQLCDELDFFTAPRMIPVAIPTHKVRGVLYKSEFIPCRYLIDIHFIVMQRLFMDYPDMRDEMARAVRFAGMYRRYVSRERSKLYDSRSLDRYARPLVEGWYIDTNITTPERIERILTLALRAVGLRWDEHVIAQWYAKAGD